MEHEILLLILKQKRKQQFQKLRNYLLSMDRLTNECLNPAQENFEALQKWICDSERVSKEIRSKSKYFIRDLQYGNKHHDIHCITIDDSFNSLIGMPLLHFANLLNHFKTGLKKLLPNTPFLLQPNGTSKYCSIRMKVFLYFYNLSNGHHTDI
jgi:hypothetical protein